MSYAADPSERMTSMKKPPLASLGAMAPAKSQGRRYRFQIYRQGHAGNFSPGFGTDSAVKAVEAFLAASPAFDGGDMHLWSHREQRVCASVKWNICMNEFGFPVLHRANAFYGSFLDLIARQIHGREVMRESIQEGVRMSA
jgi:hypothetical protein